MKKLFMTAVAVPAFALAGCVSTPTPPDLSQSHPANPQAAQSSYPLPSPFLMTETNLAAVKPLPGAAEHQHDAPRKPATPHKHDRN